jgi:hypothetical protein
VLAASGIVLHARARPVIERIAERHPLVFLRLKDATKIKLTFVSESYLMVLLP